MDDLRKRKQMMKAIDLLSIMSHPVRLSILCNLHHSGEMSVSQIVAAEEGCASQSQISQFLALMRGQKMVKTRREGQSVYYRIASDETRAVIDALYNIYCSGK